MAVGPDERKQVTVLAAPERVRTGLVEGGIEVRSTGADPAEVRAVTLPVRFEMEQNPDPGTFWAVFIGLLLLGLLLPLALLRWLNWLNAKFQAPGSSLQHAGRAIRVGPGSVTLVGGSGGSPRTADFSFEPFTDGAVPTRPCREFRDGDLHFRTHVPWVPLLLPFSSVSSATKHVFASGGTVGRPHRDRDRGRLGRVRDVLALGGRPDWPSNQRAGRVPIALAQTWVFAVDQIEDNSQRPDAPATGATGTLSLYISYGTSEGGDQQRIQELLSKACAELPSLVVGAADELRGTPETHGPAPPRRRRWFRRERGDKIVSDARRDPPPTFQPPTGSGAGSDEAPWTPPAPPGPRTGPDGGRNGPRAGRGPSDSTGDSDVFIPPTS